jgi:hypothetical protein
VPPLIGPRPAEVDPTLIFLSSEPTIGSRSETDAASVLERVCELAGEGTRSPIPGALNTPAI